MITSVLPEGFTQTWCFYTKNLIKTEIIQLSRKHESMFWGVVGLGEVLGMDPQGSTLSVFCFLVWGWLHGSIHFVEIYQTIPVSVHFLSLCCNSTKHFKT